ncbi:hypothetical protein HMSSN036_07920 [Paenibacillus macerans]|nr:hypothetical protein HMSSN036_07920 [Paenibacillus macerans]
MSGKYSREYSGGTSDRFTKFAFPPVDVEKAYAILDVLRDIAKARESTVARIALAWLLNQPAVTTVIVGGQTPRSAIG